jgi:hypothetical protein
MILSVVAAMATSVGASAFRFPTYDMKTGGIIFNDFRRVDNPPTGVTPLNNAVKIDEFWTEYTPDANFDVTMRLPEDVDHRDVRFIRVEFAFPSDFDIMEMSNIAIIAQNSRGGWQQHNVHADPEEKLACSGQAVNNSPCTNDCKLDISGKNPVAIIPVDMSDRNGNPNAYFGLVVTIDWTGADGVTPGKAKANLLDANRNIIPLTLHCTVTGGDYTGPCAGCNRATCECCDDCFNFPCVCACDDCDKFPCVCCPRCETAPDADGNCECEEDCPECEQRPCQCCNECDEYPCVCPCPRCEKVDCDNRVDCEIAGIFTNPPQVTAPTTTDNNPLVGVQFAIFPALLAAAAAIATVRKRK